MSIKTIIELHAHPGGRDEIVDLLSEISASLQGVPGFIGLTRYEVFDDPDMIIEIGEWQTPEARTQWIAQATQSGILEPLVAALASPSRATIIRPLD